MQNNIVLSSLALDLKRVALGLHRKSFTMADRFEREALERKRETDMTLVKPYMKTLLFHLEEALRNKDIDRKAEDALMYSTLIQNYVVKNTINF